MNTHCLSILLLIGNGFSISHLYVIFEDMAEVLARLSNSGLIQRVSGVDNYELTARGKELFMDSASLYSVYSYN